MKKVVQVLVFAILCNCVCAQMQQSNNSFLNRDLARMRHLTGNIRQLPKFFNSGKRVTQNKELKSGKSLKWECDTVLLYNTSSGDPVGHIVGRGTQTFDEYGNTLTDKFEKWENNAWVDSVMYSFTYDANGNLQTYLTGVLQNNTWLDTAKETFTFNVNGNLQTDISQHLQNNILVNYGMDTYTYDANGNLKTEVYQQLQNNVWVDSTMYSYTYNANGKEQTDLCQQWQNNAWLNNNMDTYTYDANGNVLTVTNQIWFNNAWVNASIDTYTYDANRNMLTDLGESWLNNVLVNDYMVTYTYDAKGNELTDLYQFWQNNSLVNYSMITYTYDANGNPINGKCEIWNNSTWQPGNCYRFIGPSLGLELYSMKEFNSFILYNNVVLIYIHNIVQIANIGDNLFDNYRFEAHWVSFNTGINELTDNKEQLRIYPNPANQSTVISYQLPATSHQLPEIKIYDLMGREVKELLITNYELGIKGEHKVKIDVGDLRSGVYCVRFVSDEGVQVIKFVKD